MRFLKGILYLLLFFLALTVIGREIPELLRLADDSSNDGQFVSLEKESMQLLAAHSRHDTPRRSLASDCVSSGEHMEVCASTLHPPIGPGILLFSTVHRT
jgi:hypothetical protein